MLRRFIKEILIVLVWTLFFLALCASVGISLNTPDNSYPGAGEVTGTASEIPLYPGWSELE